MNFHMPTQILFGAGKIASLKDILEGDMHAERPFLVTDAGVVEAGLAERVLSQVPHSKTFDEIEPNPKSTTVNRAAESARKIEPDAIIALGGGSAMDAAKAVALLVTNTGVIEDYEGKERYTNPPLPILAVPTTCGTGSEVTWVSVITDTRRKFKMSIKGGKMFPTVALVDPDLLISLPRATIASTGLDALTHAVEAYTVKPASMITDSFALKAVRLISGAINRAYEDIAGDHDARESLMLGSTLAGIAFGNSDVGAVHCISESIGALFDVPHGVANALFLPYVMAFNLPACGDRYADIAQAMGLPESDKKPAARHLVERIKTLSQTLGIPSFRELNIDQSHFPKISRYAFQNNSNPSNPRQANIADYQGILEDAFSDTRHR